MLYRNIESIEGYIHICDDAHRYLKSYIKERPQIYLHDVMAHMFIDGKIEPIKYCPYCGANIENEIPNASNEPYKF